MLLECDGDNGDDDDNFTLNLLCNVHVYIVHDADEEHNTYSICILMSYVEKFLTLFTNFTFQTSTFFEFSLLHFIVQYIAYNIFNCYTLWKGIQENKQNSRKKWKNTEKKSRKNEWLSD